MDCLRCGIVFSRFRSAPAAGAPATAAPVTPAVPGVPAAPAAPAPQGAPATRRRFAEPNSARRMYEGDRAGETEGQLYDGPGSEVWPAPGEVMRPAATAGAGGGGPAEGPVAPGVWVSPRSAGPGGGPSGGTASQGTWYSPPPGGPGGGLAGGLGLVRPAFSVSEVLSDTCSIVFSNLLPFLFMAALVYAPVVAASVLVAAGGGRLAVVFDALVALLAAPLITGALTYGVAQELRKRQATVADCLRIGLGSTVHVLAISFLEGLALFFGFVACVVPGLFLLSALSVAVPVTIEERPGILASLKRSFELTEGVRLPIFGVMILIIIAGALVQRALMYFLGGTPFGGAIPLAVVRMVDTIFEATAAAVIYYRLRSAREGVELSSLTSVFD